MTTLDQAHSNLLILKLRYFQRALDKDSFIDVSDGVSSVADLEVSDYDGRLFSKSFNGSLTLKKLLDSSAVKENRKGLEDGDDLADAIEEFVKSSVYKAVSEKEEEQRSKERERRLSAANEKMQELSKFLRKCELNFKLELKESSSTRNQIKDPARYVLLRLAAFRPRDVLLTRSFPLARPSGFPSMSLASRRLHSLLPPSPGLLRTGE
jgi:hypothetical protein